MVRRLEELLGLGGVPRGPVAAGILEGDLDGLAQASAQEWTAQYNPRPVDISSLRGLLREALGA